MGYSLKQQFQHHAKQSKKGAVNKDGKPLSDFARGEHMGQMKQMKSQSSLWKKQQAQKSK